MPPHRLTAFLLLVVIARLMPAKPILAWQWIPTDVVIQAYRKSRNAFSEGPLLMRSVDIHPQGPLSIRPFVFSEISGHQYGNQLAFATDRRVSPVSLHVVSPQVTVTDGLTNHLELVVAASLISFWAPWIRLAHESSASSLRRGGTEYVGCVLSELFHSMALEQGHQGAHEMTTHIETNWRKAMEHREPIDQWNHQEVEDTILRSLKGIRYGSIEIIVHDSRIVQIERKEKLRFDASPARAGMKSVG